MRKSTTLSALCLLLPLVHAQASSASSSFASVTATPTTLSSTGTTSGVPTITVSTAVASASAPSAPLPSQIPLPPRQAWCPSDIFCAGPILQSINLADLYADPKTVVDKPTNRSSADVVAAFSALGNNATQGAVQTFVDTNFRGEGLELQALSLPEFEPEPAFLGNVSNPLVREWARTVHGYWTQLIRGTRDNATCPGGTNTGPCESSLIPLNHTFVVPGGRFREQYYWDSYWIVLGLIQSELYETANATLQNFMDELESFGFIPNGGRIYYLNRSQPPVFIHMLYDYVTATNDTSILRRAFPLAEAELEWWRVNRTVSVQSPFTNNTYNVSRYAVTNSAPRPESYLQDYTTATSPELPALNETARSALYAELASGAESGWDYTSRWFSDVTKSGDEGLRGLQVTNVIPIDLNSILYNANTLLARLYTQHGNLAPSGTNATTAARRLQATASSLRAAILDLHWDPSKLAFYDYHISTRDRSSIFSAASFYPLWNGILPPQILTNETAAFGVFSSLNVVLRRYNGTFPATFLTTGQQWDAPNAWPPHQQILMAALEALPANITRAPLPVPAQGQNAFSLVPAGQLGLDESALPAQPVGAGRNASASGAQADINALNGTVINGGNVTEGEGWAASLKRQLANRYISSALCSWYATGGEIPGILPRLSAEELNITQSVNNTGNMFEKFSNLDIDSAGRGGEYTVQAGFGWTNGVALWAAARYGDVLNAPACPDIRESAAAEGGGAGSGGGGQGGGASSSTAAGGGGTTGTGPSSPGASQTGAPSKAGKVSAGMWTLAMGVLATMVL